MLPTATRRRFSTRHDRAVVSHRHAPLYRVVKAGYRDPLDATYSQRNADRRWNTEAFPALYCCCSTGVARAVALDIHRIAGLELEDLQPDVHPQLAEIEWRGDVVDMVTERGVVAAGFTPAYPHAVDRAATRAAAERWHAAGAEGVCARSASLDRRGFGAWRGDHRRYGETAIYVENVTSTPLLRRRRDDVRWLRARRSR